MYSGAQDPISGRKTNGGSERKPEGKQMERHNSQEAQTKITKRWNVIMPLYLKLWWQEERLQISSKNVILS